MNKLKSKPNSNIADKDDILQAVILMETFNTNFAPASLNACFLKLVNKNLIDYTIEWLRTSGVQDIILLCSQHVNEVKQYVRDQGWSELSIRVLVSEGCNSMGDIMRALDRYAVVRSNFILLSGDIVGNVDLLPLLQTFEEIRVKDKGAVMMVLYKETGKYKIDTKNAKVVAYNQDNKIIYYQPPGGKEDKLKLPMEIVLENGQIEIRNDISNTGVSICSLEVPSLFSDNFDFQSQNDFIRGLLMNEEILASTVYCNILRGSSYIAKVRDWPSYQRISQDIISRWVFPMVPDITDKYNFRRNNIYLKDSVVIDKNCIVGPDVVIGDNTKIGSGSHIANSIIGSNCIIGNNVTILESFIFGNVTTKNNVIIKNSVVAENSVIEKCCVIEESSILGPNTKLEVGTKEKRLYLICQKDMELMYKPSDQEDVPDESQADVLGIRGDINKEFHSTDVSSTSGGSSRSASPQLEDVNIFYNEVIESLTRGYEERFNYENLILEINSSRYAYNVSVGEVNFHLVRAVLMIDTKNAPKEETQNSYIQQLKLKLKYFQPLLLNYIKNNDAQLNCLQAIEDVLSLNKKLLPLSPKIFHLFYDKEIISEEIILSWYNSIPDEAVVKANILPFISWLKEADEESESE